MKRAIPFLVVFVVGVAVGYLVALQATSSPQPAPTESAQQPVPVDEPAPPLREDAPPAASEPPPATLQGPKETEKETRPPRVTSDGRVEVAVRLVRQDGSVPEEGMLYWASDPSTPQRRLRRTNWKAPQTSAWVEPGDVWIFGTAGVAEGLKSEAMQLRSDAEAPLQEVELVLRERAGVYGKVVLPGDFDRPGLEVRLHRYEGTTPPEKPVFERSDPNAGPEEREGYTFAFHDLEPGGYLLGLSLGRERFVVVENVWVDDAMVEQDLVLARFDPHHYMEVRVLGPDGKPLRDAQVSISFSGGSISASGGNVELLRKDGTVIVDHSPEFTLREGGTYKDGVYTVHVRTQEYGEIVRPYDPRTTHSLTIRVHEMETLRIRLTGYEGSPAVGQLTVGLRPVGVHGVRNPKPVEADGTVSFGKVQPGDYEVVIMAGRPQRELVAVHGVTFANGDAEKEIPTPVFHRLILRLSEHAVEPSFGLWRLFGDGRWSCGGVRDEEAGTIVFTFLTEGTYTLEGHVGERWIKREVHVPTESVVDLR